MNLLSPESNKVEINVNNAKFNFLPKKKKKKNQEELFSSFCMNGNSLRIFLQTQKSEAHD